jgi:hypothetical protein
MGSKMGRAIVANASMQLLLKQSTSAVDVLAEVFKLTDEEKKRLAQFPVGQGLFFAGQNHVHMQIIASPTETSLITTNPAQIQQLQNLYTQQSQAPIQAPTPDQAPIANNEQTGTPSF